MSSIIECPHRNELELLATSLDMEAELERLAEHLEQCEHCADVVESRLAADTILQSFQTTAPDAPVGDPLVANLIERLSAWGRLRHRSLAETTTALSTSGSGTPPREASDAADFLAPPEMPDELGRLGGYRVLRSLGAGGMGLVFEAEDPKLRRRVALKVMKPALAADESARQRFLHEAQSTAALDHDHIVTVHQVGEDRGLPFLAMPLLKGETLDECLRRIADRTGSRVEDAAVPASAVIHPSTFIPHPPLLPLSETLRIGREMAAGLAAAHARGLIHRDVKPSNVWLEGTRGRVKLLDFGLARAVAGEPASDRLQLTQEGQIVGTPAYMAPEQAQGRTLDQRCDLFSLGCVLYRMSTGQLPFRGPDAVSTLVAISTARPRPPREINADLPAGLSNLILSLLAKDRAARPASAQAVFEEIEKIEAGTRQQGAGNRVSRRWPWAIAAAAAAAMILAGIVIIIHNKDGSVAAKISLQPGESATVGDDKEPAVDPASRPTARMPRRKPPGDPPVDVRQSVANIDAAAPNPLDGRPLRSFGFLLDQLPTEVPLVAQLGDPRLGHRWHLTCVAYSPDGAILAAAGLDKLIVLHDATSCEVLRTLRGHSSRIDALAFQPDGKIVASGGGGEVKFWDVATGEERLSVPGNVGDVRSMVFVRNGSQLAVGTNPTIKLYNVETGELAEELKVHTDAVFGLSVSPDARWLASCAGLDRTIRIWSMTEEKDPLVFDCDFGSGASNRAVAFHPGGKRIAVGGWRAHVIIVDAETGKNPKQYPSHSVANCLAFSPDGTMLAACGGQPSGAGGFVDRWDVASGAMRPTVWLPGQSANSCMFSRDGRQLAVAANGYGAGAFHGVDYLDRQWEDTHQISRAFILDAGDGRPLVPAAGHSAPVSGLAFGPGGDWLASGGYDGKIDLWDMKKLEPTRTFATPHDDKALFDNTIHAVAASPDGQWLAGSVGNKEVRLWEVATRGEPLLLPGACFSHGSLAFSPDSRLLAVGTSDHLLRVWDVTTGKERWKLTGRADEARVVAFSPDGKMLASGGKGNGVINLWDPQSGGDVGTFAGPGGDVVALAFVDDGTLAVGSADGTVRLRAVPSGESLAVLLAEEAAGELTALAVPPGGEWLATAHADSTVRVWDIVRREVERSFPLAAGRRQVFRLAYTPEGRYLAAAMADGTIDLLRLAEASGGRQPPGDAGSTSGQASRPTADPLRGYPVPPRQPTGDSSPSANGAPAASANSPLDAFPLRAKGHALPQIADTVPIVAELGDSRLTVWCQHIDRVVFSPDGTRFAFSGQEDGSISIGDAATFEVMHELQAHRGFVLGIAFHPKQNTLASCGADGQVKLWDVETGQERATFAGVFSVPWGGLTYNPDGTLLAVSADPNVANPTIKICNPATGAVERELADDGPGRGNMSFSPDGKMLARARENAIHRWNCDDWSKLEPLQPGIDVRSDVVFSPDGHSLAAPGHSSAVVAWDADSGKESRRFVRHPIMFSTAAYSPDGQTLATGGMVWDGYQAFVDFWDASDATRRSTLLLAGHSTAISCAYHRDGTTLAVSTGGQNWGENPGRVFMYDVEQGRMRVPDGSGHTAAVSSVAFSGRGRHLVSASFDHTVRVWDLEKLDSVKTLKPRQNPIGLTGVIQAVAASADGELLASVTYQDSVQIWNANTGEELLSLPGGGAAPASVTFNSDGRLLAVGTHDRLVHVWDPASGTERWKLEGHTDQVSSVAFSSDGQTLASGGHDKTVNFWDMETGKKLGTAGGLLDKVVAMGFLGDGRTLVVAGADGTIQWREAPTGRVRGTLAADVTFGSLTAMAIAPGGDTLASAYADGNVRLWNVEKREIEHAFPLVPGGNHIKHLAFSPEGRHLAVALSNGSIYLLRVGEAAQANEGR